MCVTRQWGGAERTRARLPGKVPCGFLVMNDPRVTPPQPAEKGESFPDPEGTLSANVGYKRLLAAKAAYGEPEIFVFGAPVPPGSPVGGSAGFVGSPKPESALATLSQVL
ncbi:hypothetical protein MC885_014022 [Smutsia gigantea]|nr:hypothetical protein MC885_014022 [Smutsia gigantea]